MIRLSICIPTRNRQEYAFITATDIMKTMPSDVEIVVCDNSDDTQKINELFANTSKSNRLKLLTSETRTLSMRENWEKAIKATSGEWVAFIGDDDYIDPEISNLLRRLAKSKPDVDCLQWSHLRFEWPEARTVDTTVDICLRSELKPFPRQMMQKRLIEAQDLRPTMICTPYHAALRRDLINKVGNLITKDGVFFKHSNVDYYSGWLASVVSKEGVFSLRPLSVSGASKSSNSAYIRTGFNTSMKRFSKEASIDLYPKENHIEGEATESAQSITEYFDAMFLDFARQIGRSDYDGEWHEKIHKRAMRELDSIYILEEYEMRKEALNKYLTKRTGKEINHAFLGKTDENLLARGLHGDSLYARVKDLPVSTPFEFYKLISAFLRPVAHIGENVMMTTRS